MALSIGELVAYILADDRGFRRGTRRAQDEMQRFQRDSNGRLRDMRGRFASEGQAAGEGFERGIRRGFRRSSRDVDEFFRDSNGRLRDSRGRFVREGEESGRGWGRGLARAAGRALKAGFGAAGKILGPLRELPLRIAAIIATAATAGPLLAPVAGAIAEVGSAAVSAAPALLALFAAFKIASLSLKALFAEGSAAVEALSPLKDALDEATEAGQKAAARGIRPLAEQLKKVVQPTVTKYMEGVGRAANIVQKQFLKWGASAAGLRAIKGILNPISESLQKLAPKVSKVAISFTAMLGRIMGVSTAAGSKGAAKALDWLSEKLDAITKDSVQKGLDKLKSTFVTIKNAVMTVVGWIDKLVEAYKMYTTQFGLLADAVSIAAIIFGGPLTAIIAGAGLIIRHFDQVKKIIEQVKKAFKSPIAGGFFDNLKKAGAEVWPALKEAFDQIKTAVLPVLEEIWTKIKTELVPAFGEFLVAAAPVVSWLIGVLGPVVADVFKAVLMVISGTIDIIVGIFKILTGILTGDWSKCWDGIKKILEGATKLVLAILVAAVGLIKLTFWATIGILKGIMLRAKDAVVDAAHAIGPGIGKALRAGWGLIKGALSWVKDKIVGAFSGAGRWLWNAGKSILQGLLNGIESMIGTLKSKLGNITSMIPDLKGPMSVDLRLLEPSGAAIMSGLIDGITGAVPALTRTLSGVTAGIPAAAGGGAGAGGRGGGERVVRVVLDVTGGDEALVKVVRGWIRNETGGDVQAALGQG